MIDYTKNFHYLDLKPIPESLYSDIWKDLNNPTLSDLPMDKYQISDVNDRLKDCMHDIFNGTGYQFDCVNVQRISKDLKWHIDGRRISVCNFLIQPGGENVKTLFPDEELVIEPFKWHHLNVQRWHRVINLSQPPRLAICVFKEVRRPHDAKLPDFPTPYIN